MHIFSLSTHPNAHLFTVEFTLLCRFLWFFLKYCHLLFSQKICIISYIYLFLPAGSLYLPFQYWPRNHQSSSSPPQPLPHPPSLRCWVQDSADICQAMLCCHSVVPSTAEAPPPFFVICHFFPHFTLCFLVSEFELILGAVPIRFLNYHLVFSPHRSSFCPITADIRISAITHGLE